MRSIDWSKTPVGPVESWPPALRTTLSILLTSQHPIFIYWGPALVQFYNDAYRPILGSTKHPAAMGQPGRECWKEIWDVIGPLLDRAWAGDATYVKDGLLALDRHGFLEECYFNYAYTPIRDETGAVAGIFVPCSESTGRILGERRLRTLGTLSARASEAKGPDEACRVAASVLADARSDVPFALLYLLDEGGATAHLAGSMGIEAGHRAAPSPVRIPDTSAALWPFKDALVGTVDVTLGAIGPVLDALAGGPWPESPSRAVVMPLSRGGEGRLWGFAVFGISPRLILDEAYRGFLQLVARHISAAIQNADAHAEERRRGEKLAELDQLKTQFFANVSHELRTPLALILGPTEKLLASPALSTSERETLDLIDRNARLLLKQVNDLLDVSKLEAGEMVPRYVHMDLAAWGRVVASHFDVLAQEKRIGFTVEVQDNLTAQVDPDKLQQILLNLLSNAFKFTPAGGRIRCTVRDDADRRLVLLEVGDSGPGVPEGQRGAVFERFRQLEGGSTRRFGGTGLGLAIAHDLVQLHRGRISIAEAPEGGALFQVEIPVLAPAGVEVHTTRAEALRSDDSALVTVQQLRPSREREAPKPSGNERGVILVVEDNPEMNRFISESLAGEYHVTSAFNGREGLRKAVELEPDLILSDIMMPEMSGDELVRAIREYAGLASVPILLLTAKADEELRVRLLREGAQDFVMKPFRVEELRARVGNLVSLKRARGVLQHDLELRQDDLEVLANEMRVRKRRATFLAEASRLLGASLDMHATLQRIVRLAIPTMADFCIVDLLEERRIKRVAIAHADSVQEALLVELQQRFPPDWDSPQPAVRVLHSGRPELLEDITPAVLLDHTRSGDHAELMRRIGVRSHMAVPLIARGQVLGAINLGITSSARRYQTEDIALAEDLANRAALAIDNARLYKEAREAIDLRDEFLSIASHELRTPLTPLQLLVKLLLSRVEELAKGPTPRAWLEQRLERIARQGNRLERLVKELLDVSRISGGHLRVELELVDLTEIVREAEQRLEESGELARSGSRLVVELGEKVIGHWDRIRLEQVVENLLLNALKYGQANPVTVRVRASGSTAILTIQDQGIGISPEHRERIFGKFERAVSARHYGGLGMGLYIVNQVVRALEGTVEVESAPEVGSTFIVKLPLAGPRQEQLGGQGLGSTQGRASQARH